MKLNRRRLPVLLASFCCTVAWAGGHESPGKVLPGRLPRSIELFLYEDLVDSARPGEVCIRLCPCGLNWWCCSRRKDWPSILSKFSALKMLT